MAADAAADSPAGVAVAVDVDVVGSEEEVSAPSPAAKVETEAIRFVLLGDEDFPLPPKKKWSRTGGFARLFRNGVAVPSGGGRGGGSGGGVDGGSGGGRRRRRGRGRRTRQQDAFQKIAHHRQARLHDELDET